MSPSTHNGHKNNASTIDAWHKLTAHKADVEAVSIIEMFKDDLQRFQHMSFEAVGVFLDYSKNRVNKETFSLLFELARERKLESKIKQLMQGEFVNFTENRQAQHTALRAMSNPNSKNKKQAETTLKLMRKFVEDVHQGQWLGYTRKQITDVVNIGIGGSDLGPLMVTEALKPFKLTALNCHFVSNVDPSDIIETLKLLDPETTLFVVASKTFTTLETLENATTAKQWLIEHGAYGSFAKHHFIAVSANIKNVEKFGISKENVFPLWDWVGGRYSLWSTIGISIALSIGMDNFSELLSGAEAMDEHFINAPLEENMPVILALLGVWYINFWDAQTLAVLPYDHYLRYFSKYLQQLDMESNGKSIMSDGSHVLNNTAPIIWGDAGTNGQHSFHQLLHQGTRLVPIDFIIALQSHNSTRDQHTHLFSSCLSQARALVTGKTLAQAKNECLAMGHNQQEAEQLAPHKVMLGNRPSNTILINKITPQTLGALIALYEHKVYTQSIIWDINAFDQWGVELGKTMSQEIYSEISTEQRTQIFDPSTEGLIDKFLKAHV